METSTPRIEDLLTHGASLRRLASSLVASASDAEDLVQETWLAALVRGPAQHEEAKAWLVRVLRNKATSRMRSQEARLRREQEGARSERLPSAAVLASQAEMSRRMVELVLELPEDFQRVLLARYFGGLSSAEIARRMDRPAASVRSQLKRGLDELRQRLDAENEGERERWLHKLTPLTAFGTEGAALGGGSVLGPLLAVSAATRVLVGAAVVFLAAGAWWLGRGPAATPPPSTVVVDASPMESPPNEGVESESLAPAPATEGTEERVPLVSAPVADRSPIQGRVVHPKTGEPVIWFELGVVLKEDAQLFQAEVTEATEMPETEGMELVRTDETGHFATEGEYESGSYALVPVEDWRVARTKLDLDRIRQPRAPMDLEHDATTSEELTFELETGPVFVVDCPKAIELGAQSMVAIYSYLDHYPPGYFRPSPLQVEPVPFVRMHTDYAASRRNEVTNLRLVSEDGFWSGSVPMEIPDSIATQYVSFELEARAVVDVDLDFGDRKPPLYLELHYWEGAVDPGAGATREPDIVELQAMFDGTDLEEAIVKYVRTGTATVGIKASTSEYWHRVVELAPGYNSLQALIAPDPVATGRIEGRVVYLGKEAPEQVVRVIANSTLHGEPTFPSLDLEFEDRGDMWVADFTFTHLPVATHTLWFDKGGPATHDAKTFAIEPARLQLEVDGPPVEFELFTDLTRTRLLVKARDGATGKKIREFGVSVFVPGSWLLSRRADSKAGRVSMKLIGDLEGGLASLAADGYVRVDVPLSEAEESKRGLELEVEMMPGWGGPVYATHADTYEPLPDVRVLLDGIEVGTTDEAGQLQVAVPSAPQRVDFELDGYVVAGQSGWVDSTGEVIPVGLDPIQRYLGVSLRER